jgi:hypothetical protein
MKPERVETLVWLLIYGGLLGVSLGWFVQLHSDLLGWVMIVAGAIVAALGAVLIVVRARMKA